MPLNYDKAQGVLKDCRPINPVHSAINGLLRGFPRVLQAFLQTGNCGERGAKTGSGFILNCYNIETLVTASILLQYCNGLEITCAAQELPGFLYRREDVQAFMLYLSINR